MTTSSERKPRAGSSERVVQVLSDRIKSGMYHPGEMLPTERYLASDLQVHRRSIRTAIDRLVEEGIVSRRPNCRPTVGDAPAHPSRVPVRKTSSRISASNLIALIMWHGGGPLEHAGTSQQRIFWGMNQFLMKAGYHAVFLDLGGEHPGTEEENAEREAKHLRYIKDQGFGGALFYPYAYRSNSELVHEVSQTVPLVMLDRTIPKVALDFVGIQNYEAMFELTHHLLAQGHRRIAHITRSEPLKSVQDRALGYLDGMRSAGFEDMQELIIDVPHYPYDDDRAWTVVDAVFNLPAHKRPTAAACCVDYLAVALANRLAHLGFSVPNDVALSGFDNIVPALPNGVGLTSMAQPYEEIGRKAAELLLRRIHAPHIPPSTVELPARLICRDSTAQQSF